MSTCSSVRTLNCTSIVVSLIFANNTVTYTKTHAWIFRASRPPSLKMKWEINPITNFMRKLHRYHSRQWILKQHAYKVVLPPSSITHGNNMALLTSPTNLYGLLVNWQRHHAGCWKRTGEKQADLAPLLLLEHHLYTKTFACCPVQTPWPPPRNFLLLSNYNNHSTEANTYFIEAKNRAGNKEEKHSKVISQLGGLLSPEELNFWVSSEQVGRRGTLCFYGIELKVDENYRQYMWPKTALWKSCFLFFFALKTAVCERNSL